MNQVVVHYLNGKILKGLTVDFLPTKDRFHLVDPLANPGTHPAEVLLEGAKAVFFVKDLEGNAQRKKHEGEDPARAVAGRKIRVTFKDGEILLGTTMGYQPGRPGFFVSPLDPGSNNERCFVLSAATQNIQLL